MTGRHGRLGKLAARAAILPVAAVVTALLVPTAAASPESDAHDAITAAWQAAGGEASALGAPHGDVYPAGAGFVQDFGGGKMFFTPATGAHAMYGAILDKYDSLGGAAGGDLGFPNIDEVTGLFSPDSRMATFSAADNPVIYWTPEHGAHVVRGPINAGWDRLGSSTGPLGVPVEDETYDGEVVAQKFSAGQLAFNSLTKAFTTVPPELAAQLADLQVQADPTAAINWAWRAAGGASGPLGAKQGQQYQVGTDGAGQDFAGGKVYFGPATGAHALDGDVLAKYESLGGPAGSDLGYPTANEADGAIPGSRVATFSADNQPVIFFTPGNGAFVVRDAMKAAWDKLGGAAGGLGAPTGDQTVEGNAVSQKFTGGKVSWDRVNGKFSTEPPGLAKSLSGLQVPGLNMPNPGAGPTTGAHNGWHWHWWWLLVAAAALALVAALAWAAMWWQRRRPRGDVAVGTADRAVYGDDDDDDDDHDADERWQGVQPETDTTVRLPSRYADSADESPSGVDLLERSAPGVSWPSYAETGYTGPDYAGPDYTGPDYAGPDYAGPEPDEDPDDVDTAPTRIPSEAELGSGRHSAAGQTADSGGTPAAPRGDGPGHPAMHLPLDDPYQAPDGYPVKANMGSGLYYTDESPLYDDTLAEIWFASEEAAQLNGFVKAR